jgi:DMSO/TMAO reductase YedYZ molybdopterin-dependent catalytic subunit
LHDERNASWLGLALGVTFALCFVTGLVSHAVQRPPPWFAWPARPAGLYRVTQGVHVAAGIASVPLLLAKLWTVYPKLWIWPAVENAAHAMERVSLVPLVAGSLFLLFSGTANIAHWYPWGFFFPAGHFWAAWITIGALVVHVGAKATVARRSIRAKPRPDPVEGALTRRGFLALVGATTAALVTATTGQTAGVLRRIALLAPRRPEVGPQGFPVNKTARSAGVTELARDPGYRIVVTGNVATPLSLTIAELNAMPQHEATLPIACVDGWSASARWRGVRVRDVLARAGARAGSGVIVESLQPAGLYRAAVLSPSHATDPDTLLALRVNGEVLHIEHGYPCRLIGPNRPGVMQTKWISKLVVR